MNAPCKDCTNRTATCHGWCEKYLEYAKEREKFRETINKAKNLKHDYVAMRNSSLKRRKKGNNYGYEY